MAQEIDNFKLKLRNTVNLKRPTLTLSVAEGQELAKEIKELEAHIDQLEIELLQKESMSIDIVGRDF
jgi:uncharacterized protein Yka (UPF0111/DUF47 family)